MNSLDAALNSGQIALIRSAEMRGASNDERPTTSSDVVVDRRLENALWIRFRLTSSAANELQILRADLGELLALLESEVN